MMHNQLILGVCGTIVVGAGLGAGWLRHPESSATTERQMEILGTYPVKITGSLNSSGDQFGNASAFDGDTAVVGAPFDATVASSAGIAYIFQRDEDGADAWGEVRTLQASDGAANDHFGTSVAIDGDYVVVGAPRHNGNRGAAYVFYRDQGGSDNWGEVAKLTADDNDADAGDSFGSGVAIEGDVVVVGAYGDDEEGESTGAVYVFVKPGGGWTDMDQETAKLTDSAAIDGDAMGRSVAIDGGVIVGGAEHGSSGGGGIGIANVYVEPGGGWADKNTWNAQLSGSDIGSQELFGHTVDIDGNTIVVGAYLHDVGGNTTGAAYVLRRVPVGPEHARKT